MGASQSSQTPQKEQVISAEPSTSVQVSPSFRPTSLQYAEHQTDQAVLAFPDRSPLSPIFQIHLVLV